MKKIYITLAILFTTFLSNAQIGVITIKKNESVPLNMWYTIDDKGRKNNIYITYDDENLSVYSLEKLLSQFDMEIDLPSGKDDDGDAYWAIEQDNGYISDLYYIKEKKFPLFTIIIVTVWGGE